MLNLNLKYSKVKSFEEFINFFGLNKLKYVNTKDVPLQRVIIRYLLSLLNRKIDKDYEVSDIVLIFPGCEEFLAKLLNNLDSTLESQAKELFQYGCAYIASCIGNKENLYIVRRLLDVICERFPDIKACCDQQLNNFIRSFSSYTIKGFFDENKSSIEKLAKKFPCSYDLFIKPIIADSNIDRKLYNYYCNPYIYGPLMEYLSKQEKLARQSKTYIKWMEECLMAIRSFPNNNSWKELVCKASDLHKSSNDLESFASACSGLIGEIRAAYYFVCWYGQEYDELVFLEDKNRKNGKIRGKNCDLMMINTKSRRSILVEVKSKSARHGVENSEFSVYDDFFSNYSSSISKYLSYLDLSLPSICGLSLRKSFPLFFIHEGSCYGKPLSLVNHIVSQNEEGDCDPNKLKSQTKIEKLLKKLYLKPIILSSCTIPLENEDTRLAKRKEKTKKAFEKEWVKNTIIKGVAQLKEAYSFQLERGRVLSKLVLALNLSLSYRLLQDPLSYNNGNIKDIAELEIYKVFEEVCSEEAQLSIDFELLLL